MSTLYVNNIEPVSGSSLTLISASLVSVDSLSVVSLTSSFQGNLQGTASFATTASFALNSTQPGGTEGQIQFNSGSIFGADSNLFWDNTNKRLGVGTNTPIELFSVQKETVGFAMATFIGHKGVTNYNGLRIGTHTNAVGYIQGISGLSMSANYDIYLQPFGGGVFIGSSSVTPTARLQIKGSGTTAATTALLVQNSSDTQNFRIDDSGTSFAQNYNTVGILGTYIVNSRLSISSPLSGNMLISAISSADFGRLMLGGTTNAFPAIKRNGTAIDFRLADDSAFAPINAGATTLRGSGTTAATTSLLVQNSAGVASLQVLDDTSVFNNGKGAVATNTAFGNSALIANTTGGSNTANGVNALAANTTGGDNTANGVNALALNASGTNNTAIGVQALFANNGANNTAIGRGALRNNTASNNVAVGYEAAFTNTTATSITAIGYQALRLSTGNNNTATGFQALASNTTGTDNTAYGYIALLNNSTGSNNTALGRSALQNNTTGANNTALGYQAGDNITTGAGNVCIGSGAEPENATDSNKFVVGTAAINAGAVTTEVIVPDTTWTVRINGANYKIAMLAI
jgi:hypothetical protein